MIEIKQIVWSENCVDPGSRVFFIGDRVFRAYEESRKQETLDFIASECYSVLRENQMIVKTWIVDEIQLEGYPLILEHERLCCMPEKWLCFDMMKDILTFHFEVNELCRKYGYGIRDIGYGNVTLNNGKLCFTDFGSFRKMENIDPNIYEQYCLPLAYLPLAMNSRNDGTDFLADCMIGDYDKWITAQTKPSGDTLLTNHYWSYLHPIVSSYTIRLRRSNIHLKVRTAFSVWLVQKLNAILQVFVPRGISGRNIFDITPMYSEDKAKKHLPEIQFPYSGTSVYPMEEQAILQNIPNVIVEQIKHSVKRIVLWGNFAYDDLYSLKKAVDAEVIVMSSDRIYTNNLYKQIRQNKDDIMVICCNAMRGKDFNALKSIARTDMLILQKEIFMQVHIGTHSDWAEKASHFAEYVFTSTINDEEMRLCHINEFHRLEGDNKYSQYQLYKNKYI